VWTEGEPVPLAVYEAPCFFRQRALDTLDRAGISWRIAFTSPSLGGLWAAVEAGLGITLRTPVGLPSGVRVLAGDTRLPSVQAARLEVCLHDGGRAMEPRLSRLRSIIHDALRENIPSK
jgi:DNA-binding transcriptional LysR family regulator